VKDDAMYRAHADMTGGM